MYSTLLFDQTNSNLRFVANKIAFQTWQNKRAQGNTQDTNITTPVLMVSGGNVGVGQSQPKYALDVSGDVNVLGSLLSNSVPIAQDWRKSGSTVYVDDGVKIGIGTSVTNTSELYVKGSITTSNITVKGSLSFDGYTVPERNPLQIAPVKGSFLVSQATQYIFYLSTSGVYNATPAKTDVYMNGLKLAYSNATTKDYDVVANIVNGTSTLFTITLVYPAVYSDVVDIVVFPSFIDDTATNIPGYVYQQITNNVWLPNGNNSYFSHTGNVGIGTSSPTSKVDVYGTIAATSGFLLNGSGDMINKQYNSTSNRYGISESNGILRAFISGYDQPVGSFRVSCTSNALTTFDDILTVTRSGNVGIGTTNPLSTCEIYNTTFTSQDILNVYIPNLSTYETSGVRIGKNTSAYAFLRYFYGQNSVWSNFYIGINGVSTPFISARTEGLNGSIVKSALILTADRISIDTTTGTTFTQSLASIYAQNTAPPTRPLILQNTSTSQSAGIYTGLSFYLTGTSSYGSGGSVMCDQRVVRKTTNTSEASMIWGACNSGGTAYQDVMELNTNTGNLLIRGSLTSLYTFSDERLKNDIMAIPKCLDKLDSIQVVEYTWNDKIPSKERVGTRDVGLLAQNVATLFPLATTPVTNLEDGKEYMGIHYEKMIPYIIKSIQELRSEVAEWKAAYSNLLLKLEPQPM